jgi:hypothetical protein
MQRIVEHQPRDLAGARAERQPDAELAGAQADQIREHAVYAEQRDAQCDGGECSDEERQASDGTE